MQMRFGAFFCLFFLFQPFTKAQIYENQTAIAGTVFINDKTQLNAGALMTALKTDWKIEPSSNHTVADKTIIFEAYGTTVMIAQLPYTADPIEIRAAAQLSWLWKTAAEEALRHQSQISVSVVGPAAKLLEIHQLFTKVTAAVLESSKSSGVYMNSRYLLLSKGFYTAAAHNMLDNNTLPAYCWVYFGMPGDGGAYTFGLQEFGLKEMEIVKSSRDNTEVHAALYDATVSVLKNNQRPIDGETVLTEEGSKIKVRAAAGFFVEGKPVLRLEY